MKISEQVSKEIQSDHPLAYFNVLRTANWIEVMIKEALKPLEITHAQLNVLSLLAHRHPRPMSAGAVKAGVIVSSPDITRLIDRLEKKAFVSRNVCPDNRRQMEIRITSKGMTLFHNAHRAAMEVTETFFHKKISREEARRLTEALQAIRK